MKEPKKADVVRVFLASPGDVAEERAFVRHYLESVLPKSRFLTRKVTFEVVSWDDPADGVPLSAHLTPQESVIRFKGKPSACHFVIVILRDRLGTHLALDSLARPDGTRFLSGTEWEFENAFNAAPRPEILVYRGLNVTLIRPDDPEFDEKRRQLLRVTEFFKRFEHPDGAAKGGFKTYADLAGFKTKLANDLETVLEEWLRDHPSVSVEHGPAAGPIMTLTEASAATIPLPDRCFGRDADRETIVAALLSGASPNAVLVLGPGGIGKTTLTQAAATDPRIIARFGARRWFVELETAVDRDTFDAAILVALGLDPARGFEAARVRLAQEPSLLVLDNLESPWDKTLLPIEQRLSELAAIPGLVLLASFRGDEAVGGAHWSPRHTVRPLTGDDSRALFFDIAAQIPSDDPHLPDLLRELGGVPLAICLTARRAARHDNLTELWSQLLATGTAVAKLPGEEHRLTSVPRSIEFSLQSSRMKAPGLRLFRLLGQLPAGIADADRQSLLGAESMDAFDQILGVGLAMRDDFRLDLLPPVRDHARRAYPPPDGDTAWFHHYLSLAAEHGTRIGRDGGAAAIERLAPELANIDAAVDAAIAARSLAPAIAAQRNWGLSNPLRFSGLGSPRALTALAAACAAAEDAAGQAVCLFGLGDIALARSDHDAARARYEAALPLYRRVGNVNGEANCIESLGDIALARSDHDAARARYEEALPLYRRVGDVLGEANCIKSLGDIALERSDHDAARARYEEALPLYRRVGDVIGEGNCALGLGRLARARGDRAAARRQGEAALALFLRCHAMRNAAIAHEDLAAWTEGENRAAHARAAAEIWRAIGLPEQAAQVEWRFG